MPEPRPPFHLLLIVHTHQPAGNFEHVFEECYRTAYNPFLTMIEKHPGVRLALHYSGPLLLWIEKNHPEYFDRLRKLVAAGRVELIGGGFYEPILISIPTTDQVEQLNRLGSYIEQHFGKRPTGAWLAERVWEPQLPGSLAEANVAYTLVDDLPFIAAGFEAEELFGTYIAEDRGKSVWLFPGLKTVTPGEFMASHLPLGRADLPAASYAEMMEWVLPTKTRQRFFGLEKEFVSRPDVLTFLRGGVWRGFFRKYPESNLLHKKMLRASAAVASIPTRRTSVEYAAQNQEARDRVLRGQGNDAYWHGVFGGIYAPHLRTEIWRNLIRAEALADQLTPGGLMPRFELVDYDADGAAEILFSAPEFQALLKPSDGATIAFFDFRPASATLINSVIRRPEAYHSRLREAADAQPVGDGAVSIHDQVLVKEPNLERFLRYDRYPRHAFRLLLFDPSQTKLDYEELRLKEVVKAAAGSYLLHASSANYADLQIAFDLPEYAAEGKEVPRLSITKLFLFGPTPHGCEVSCDISITLSAPLSRPLAMGVESVINFLAPTDSDRFFETPSGPQNLRFSGILPSPLLRVEDGWQKMRVTLHAPGSQEFWVAPIETVSESEGGFERVYQGSQILAVWRPDFVQHTSFSARLLWRVESP